MKLEKFERYQFAVPDKIHIINYIPNESPAIPGLYYCVKNIEENSFEQIKTLIINTISNNITIDFSVAGPRCSLDLIISSNFSQQERDELHKVNVNPIHNNCLFGNVVNLYGQKLNVLLTLYTVFYNIQQFIIKFENLDSKINEFIRFLVLRRFTYDIQYTFIGESIIDVLVQPNKSVSRYSWKFNIDSLTQSDVKKFILDKEITYQNMFYYLEKYL